MKNFHSILNKIFYREKLLIAVFGDHNTENDDVISIRFGKTTGGQRVLLIYTRNKIMSWNPATQNILEKRRKKRLSRKRDNLIKIWSDNICEEKDLLPNIAPVAAKLLANKLLVISFSQLPPRGPARRIPEPICLSKEEKLLTNTIATIWDIESKKNIGKLDRSKRSFKRGIQIIEPFGQGSIITASNDGRIEIWDLETGDCLSSFELKTRPKPTALKVLSNDGKEIQIAIGYNNGIVNICRLPLLDTMQIIFLIKFAQVKKNKEKIILHNEWQKIYKSLPDFLKK